MPKKLKPQRFVLLDPHPPQCSVHDDKIGPEKAQIVHGWYESGHTDVEIGRLGYEMGLDLTKSALGRHRAKHLRTVAQVAEKKAEEPKISDLDALEQILQQGASQIDSWKVTPSDYFKALDMKYKLTQGSAFQGMLEALAVAEDDNIELGGEETEAESPVEGEVSPSAGIPSGIQEDTSV